MEKEITDRDTTIGIIGGGQLARMSAQAAQQMGFTVIILHSDPHSPAGQVATQSILLDWNSVTGTEQLAARSSVVTLENEWVSPDNLYLAERLGANVIPHPKTLSIVGDKYEQRCVFASRGLPSPRFRRLDNWSDVADAAKEWGAGVVLKSRRGGYDGYGVKVLQSPEQWKNLPETDPAEWYIEEFIAFETELAVIVSKNQSGEGSVYPVVESRQTRDGNRCDVVIAPAPGLSADQVANAQDIALKAVDAVGGVGLYGVELFQTAEGVVINEIAPRPHNSGHYTMDGCCTSQFEQHVRAIRNLPPGSTDLLAPVIVMVNLLAPRDGAVHLTGAIDRALEHCRDIHIHWYGKNELRNGRKMGHMNLLGETLEETLDRALGARKAFWEGSTQQCPS